MFDQGKLAWHLETSDLAILASLYREFLEQLQASLRGIATAKLPEGQQDLLLNVSRLEGTSKMVGATRLAECLELLARSASQGSAETASLVTLVEIVGQHTNDTISRHIDSLAAGSR